ncbi:MAG: hypothetical protein P1V35_07640 [Planctomycetota bacterium]|nr:hypothetical protein [Planctomycetota bacterium]
MMAYLAEDRSTWFIELDSGRSVQLSDPVGERESSWTYFAFDLEGSRLCTVHTKPGAVSTLQVHDLSNPFADVQLNPSVARQLPIEGPDMVWHPRGTFVVFRIGGEVVFADPDDLTILESMNVPTEMTIGPTFHPDGVHLITRHWDSLRAWRLPESMGGVQSTHEPAHWPFLGKPEVPLAVHRTLDNLQFSPDGQHALVYCQDTRTMVVDLYEEPAPDRFGGTNGSAWPRSSREFTVQVSPLGNMIELHIFGTNRPGDRNAPLYKLSLESSEVSSSQPLPFVACSTQRRGYCVVGGKLTVWSLEDAKPLGAHACRPATSMAVNGDGTRLALGFSNGDIEIRNAETLQPLVGFEGHSMAVKYLTFSDSGVDLYSQAEAEVPRRW